jgi:hypothetical protein
MLTEGRRFYRATHFSIGLSTALYWIFYNTDPEDCKAFWQAITEDEMMDRDDPRAVLVRWAKRAQFDTRRPSQVVLAAVTIKAWNAYREHRQVGKLAFRGSEVFPEVV